MRHLLSSIFFGLFFSSCSTPTPNTDTMSDTSSPAPETTEPADTLPKVTGIGGIFFYSDDPAQTKAWYAENLGLATNEWGSSFEFRNAHRPEEINYLQWSPFKTGNPYFQPSQKPFMVNYRVQNIDALVAKLRGNGVTILDEIETYEYGKFVHIMDADGNKLELWEPVDSVLTAMGGVTTK